MPYVNQSAREKLDNGKPPNTPGELNYLITKLVDEYIQSKGALNYTNINESIGVLECAKLELYRRVAVPYENKKIKTSGDVYNC